jgi:Cu/Ag efflux pump CusA
MPAKKQTEEELHRMRLAEIREHIERLGITEQDVADAVKWARKTQGKGGILEILRSWPIADLNLKRPRVRPRKIDI